MAGDVPRPSVASSASDDQSRPMIPPTPLSLVQPSRRRRRPTRVLRLFRSLCRTLPIFTPKCRPAPSLPSSIDTPRRRLTGTLFGPRRGRVTLSLQESPRCLPSLLLELALHTHALMREMSHGMVRIALEADKRPPDNASDRRGGLLDEPLWTMFCNGKKSGYGVRREATADDLGVMELLRPVSMGAGVLPGKTEADGADGEMAYMRAHFEHVVGSRDSETLYMLGPDGNNGGPELTIFFVRI